MIAFPAAVLMFAGLNVAPASMTLANSTVIESPCVRICSLNASDVCLGCGRTITEITRWYGMSNEERSRIMAELPQRIEALGASFKAAQAS
jgi:predicted Fe-S protein YdhL (DUF1289 family)